jgi:MFS superfamily sulfate permease-like transporter
VLELLSQRDHMVAELLEAIDIEPTFLLELTEISKIDVVVLRMSRVASLDATGASVLADIIKRLEARGVTVLVSGVRDQHQKVLTEPGVYDELGHERHTFASTPEAIAHARLHAARVHHRPPQGVDLES